MNKEIESQGIPSKIIGVMNDCPYDGQWISPIILLSDIYEENNLVNLGINESIRGYVYGLFYDVHTLVYVRFGERGKYSTKDTKVVQVAFEISGYKSFATFLKRYFTNEFDFYWDNIDGDTSLDAGVFVGRKDLYS